MVGLIRALTLVSPKCLTCPSIRPFMYKFCSKGTREYPAVNMPYFCQRCRTWIWLYNIPSHYDNQHDELWDLDVGRLRVYLEWESTWVESERALV